MKKLRYIFYLVSILLVSCNKEQVEIPQNRIKFDGTTTEITAGYMIEHLNIDNPDLSLNTEVYFVTGDMNFDNETFRETNITAFTGSGNMIYLNLKPALTTFDVSTYVIEPNSITNIVAINYDASTQNAESWSTIVEGTVNIKKIRDLWYEITVAGIDENGKAVSAYFNTAPAYMFVE